jgi:hypothetical protein
VGMLNQIASQFSASYDNPEESVTEKLILLAAIQLVIAWIYALLCDLILINIGILN